MCRSRFITDTSPAGSSTPQHGCPATKGKGRARGSVEVLHTLVSAACSLFSSLRALSIFPPRAGILFCCTDKKRARLSEPNNSAEDRQGVEALLN